MEEKKPKQITLKDKIVFFQNNEDEKMTKQPDWTHHFLEKRWFQILQRSKTLIYG